MSTSVGMVCEQAQVISAEWPTAAKFAVLFVALLASAFPQSSDALDIRLSRTSNFGAGSVADETLTNALERAEMFWENALLDDRTVDIKFGWKPLGAEEWATYDFLFDTIYFNSTVSHWNGSTQDLTNRHQFQSYSVTSRDFGGGDISTGISSFSLGSGVDLYTIALHEMGHALGFYAGNPSAGFGDVVVRTPLPHAGSVLPAYRINRHLREEVVPDALMSLETTADARHLPSHADILVVAQSGGFELVNFRNIVVGGHVFSYRRETGDDAREFLGGQTDVHIDDKTLVLGGSSHQSSIVVHDAALTADSALIGWTGGSGQLEIVGSGAIVEFHNGATIGSFNQGTVKIQGGATAIMNTYGASLGYKAFGKIEVDGSGSKLLSDSGLSLGSVDGRGQIVVRNGGLIVAGSMQLGYAQNDRPERIIGLLEVSSGGRVSVDNRIVLIDGQISGSGGTIDGRIEVRGGRVAPGNSVGQLSVQGDMSFEGGVLELESDGHLDHDVLTVGGSVTFGTDSTIEFVYYAPMPETVELGLFLLAESVTFVEAWSSKNLRVFTALEDEVGQAVYVRVNEDLVFELISEAIATPIPEPNASLLGVVGLLVMAGVTRWRKRKGICVQLPLSRIDTQPSKLRL